MTLQVRFKSATIEHDPRPTTPPQPPLKRQKESTKPTEVFEYNPGQLSTLYPWYYRPQVEKLQPPSSATPSSRTKRVGGRKSLDFLSITQDDHDTDDATVFDDDAMSLDNDPLANIKLDRLPVGLKLEDIQDAHERANVEKRMEMASSTAMLAKVLDTEQLMWFFDEVKVRHSDRLVPIFESWILTRG